MGRENFKSRILLLFILLMSFLVFTFIMEQSALYKNLLTYTKRLEFTESECDSLQCMLKSSEMLAVYISKDKEFLSQILQQCIDTPDLVTATIYHPVPEQTDSTPNITASGLSFHIENAGSYNWIAISRDLLSKYKMGDVVTISGAGHKDGIYIIQDKMNPRFSKSIDFLVDIGEPINKWNNVTMQKIDLNKLMED